MEEILLDPSLCHEFRDVIYSSPIFSEGDEKSHYSLIRAVMDRLDSCLSYINKHHNQPSSEEVAIALFVFGSMIVDAVKSLHEEVGISYVYADTNIAANKSDAKHFEHFGKTYETTFIGKREDNKKSTFPTDDKFFEYMRSLVFAHPHGTNRAKFLRKGEEHYSPWIASGGLIEPFYGKGECIRIQIYSNQTDKPKILFAPLSCLRSYIKSRYELVSQVTAWARQRIEDAETKWKEQKVNRRLPPIEVLQDIANIRKSRYKNNGGIRTLIAFLECPITNPVNKDAVDDYRRAIEEIVPNLCDATDVLDELSFSETVSSAFSLPRHMHQEASYQIEKIEEYLVDNEETFDSCYANCEHRKCLSIGANKCNISWAIEQVLAFTESSTGSHVTVTPNTMSFGEIKLLIYTACFLEKKNYEYA
ncbi:MAG: hypothetical protein LBL92_04950 [Propionibacteriaceae bacterium]|jgi:hypothetical protein|nr:hypothetical protein [Propionibacteriaceae bacterium]